MVNTKKYKILITDDDSFLLDMYSLKFNERGFSVETASSADEVLDKLSNNFDVDIILLDIVMPNMDGFDLLKKIQEEKIAPNAIKIILSNLGQQTDIDRSRELGASGHIVKASATPTEVVNKVLSIVND